MGRTTKKERNTTRRESMSKDREKILTMLAAAPPLQRREELRKTHVKANRFRTTVRKSCLNCSASGNSRMRVAIETQQLIINFQELFKNGGPKKVQPGRKPRPLMEYFHRCVEKVRLTQKRCVFQEKLQKFVFNWTHRPSEVPQKKLKTREQILDDVTANASFWDQLSVASSNSGKLSIDAGEESCLARSTGSQIREPPSYCTLQDFSARRWGSDIRHASGLSSRPHTEEGRLSSTPGFNSYLELLLWEQERRSAMHRSDWRPDWTEEDFLPSIHLPVTTLSRTSHSVSSSVKEKKPGSCSSEGGLSEASSAPRRPLTMPPLDQRPPVAFGRRRPTSQDGSQSPDQRPSSKGRDGREAEQRLFSTGTDGRSSSKDGRPSSKDSSSRPSSKGFEDVLAVGKSSSRGRPSSKGRSGSRGGSRGRHSSAFGDLAPLPEDQSVKVDIPITVTTSSMSGWTWPTMRSEKFSAGRQSASSKRSAKTSESGKTSARSGDSGVGKLHDEWSSTVSRWRDNLLAPKDGTLPPTPRAGRQATGLGDCDTDTLCDEEEELPQVIYFRECERFGVLPSATNARLALGCAPKPKAGQDEHLSLKSLLAREEGRPEGDEDNMNLSLHAQLLGNSHRLTALCAALPRLGDFQLIDLSHNMLEDSSVECFLMQMCDIAQERGPWLRLAYLNLSHNRLGTRSFAALTVLFQRGLIRSRDGLEVELGGMALPPKPVVDDLVEAIHCNGAVACLRLNDCQFGRYTQTMLTCIKDLLCCPGLRKLDLSQNYIRGDGLKTLTNALGCAECLIEDLNLSGCSSMGLVAGREGEVAKAHPMLPLCEALEWNKSLIELSLADCSLNAQASLILEDVLGSHEKIQKLDVCNNTLGDNGIRALVRLMASPTSKIAEVDIRGVRQDPTVSMVNFNYGDLVEEYRGEQAIDCTSPYHRAVLRRILTRGEDFRRPPEEILSKVTLNGKATKTTKLFERLGPGRWIVPQKGRLEFYFNVQGKNRRAFTNASEMMSDWQTTRRMPVSLRRFVVLITLLDQLVEEFEFRLYFEAVARDLLLKPAQVKFFAERMWMTRPAMVPQVLSMLCCALQSADRATINAILKATRRVDEGCDRDAGPLGAPKHAPKIQKIRTDHPTTLGKLNCLTELYPDNPTGHYKFDLKEPQQYSVLDRLLLLDRWESMMAMETPDLVDPSQAGGFHPIRNMEFNGQRLSPKGFDLPGDGFTAEGIMILDYVTPNPPRPTCKAMSTELFHSVCAFLDADSSDADSDARYGALRAVTHFFYVTAYMVAELISLFEDHDHQLAIFPALWARCNETGMPINDVMNGVLGDSTGIFDGTDRHLLRQRMGPVHLFDFVNMSLHHHNYFFLDLSLRDEHMIAEYCLKLADIEPGVNLTKGTWTGAASRGVANSWFIPKKWIEECPRHGLFGFSYISEKASCIRQEERRAEAHERLGLRVLDSECAPLEGYPKSNEEEEDERCTVSRMMRKARKSKTGALFGV